MAFKSTLELYNNLILPRLADGPKSQADLDVPRYALEALQRDGSVTMRTQVQRSASCRWAVQLWYLVGSEPPPRKPCALLTDEDWPPE